MKIISLLSGEQTGGIAPHAATHHQGGADPISAEAIGAELEGTAAAAIASLLSRGNNEIFKRLSISYPTPENTVPPNATHDNIISNPTFHEGGCVIIAGAYGNGLSGNLSGFYFLSGLLFFPFPSQEGSILNIYRIVEQANGGTLNLTALSDGTLRLRMINSDLRQPKVFRVAQILI
ncbi:hypothetical protein [Laspinema olomoucense]|uniref:hypothetical protein n=1 Tax=Laspinema olomoucense TaxID=3231600 RepID=UPI0021BB24A1|nr:hypothetical protein [Laspinema sp. D3d]MCT7971079.1 hypothetical protein [Laspinema sp. D3d]